jgi:hypothetical protein
MNNVYRERVFSGVLSILPGLIGMGLLGVSIYSWLNWTFGETPAPWILLVVGILLLLAAINFAFLSIVVSYRGVTARFGLFSHTLPIDDIAGTYLDKASSIAYGGFGIRFGWVNGKRRLVYNVINAPRVVIQERRASNHEFVFSTRNAKAVMKAISEVSEIK